MSAYMVDKNHVLYLVAASISRRISHHGSKAKWWFQGDWQEMLGDDYKRQAEVAQMLWTENLMSIHARYPDSLSDEGKIPGTIGENYRISIDDITSNVWHEIDPAQVFRACDCLSYQSCEHEGWEKSESYAFLESLYSGAQQAVTGYGEAVWGAPEPDAGVVLLGAMAR